MFGIHHQSTLFLQLALCHFLLGFYVVTCCVLFFWSKQITISKCGPSDKFQHQNLPTIHLFLPLLLTVAEDPFSSKLFGRRPAGRARWSQSCFWSWSQMSRQFDYLVHVLVSSSSSSQQVLTSNDWYQCFSVIKPETHRSCTYLLCTHWD